MYRYEANRFLLGFAIYVLVFVISLVGVSRIKGIRDRAMASGSVCFGFLALPWLIFGWISLILSMRSLFSFVPLLLGIIVEACVAVFYGFSIFQKNWRLVIISCFAIAVLAAGLAYIIVFQNFDWRIGTTNTGVIWEKTIGKANDDKAKCIVQTPEGDFIIAVDTWSSGKRSDIWLIKTDSTGKIIWEQTLGGIDIDTVNRIRLTSDNGCILVGATRSHGAGGQDVWLVKVDSFGKMEWERTFGGSYNDIGEDIQILPDGYIIAGKTWTKDNETLEAWVIRTDVNGYQIWNKTYPADNDLWTNACGIQITADGGFILVGNYWSPEDSPGYYPKIRVTRIDSTGNEMWHKEFHSAKYGDTAIGIEQMADGGYVIGADSELNSNDAFWLIKINSSGDEEWDNKYGSDDTLKNIALARDGSILATSSEWVEYSEENIIVFNIDGNGKQVWSKTLDKLRNDEGCNTLESVDGDYVIVGTIADSDSGYPFAQQDIWLVKFSRKNE